MVKLFFLSFFLISLNIQSQDVSQAMAIDEVNNTIKRLFDGMRLGDSSMVHSVFSSEARMYTNFKDKNGELVIKEGDLKSFLKGVGTPHNDIWDEKIWNTKIEVEMGLAQVWTNYAFYRGDEFSHCGVNAFQLVNQNGWKIIHLIDTRKKINCEKPK